MDQKGCEMGTRVDELQEELEAVVQALVRDYGAERVILFGSAATGDLSADSDIDLVVIKETDLPFYDRLREVAHSVSWTHAFEILVYTPEEFEELRQSNAFVREEVCQKGKVLYETAA